MYCIGLTGGIGCGKSTVATLFSSYNITCIDADQISRQLTAPTAPTLKPIIQHFGPSICLPGGSLDRAVMRNIIFNDPNAKQWLEDYLHPLIREEMREQSSIADSPYCLIIIPLLAESAPIDFINRVCVVDSEPSTQLSRTMSRDNVSSKTAQAIMDQQVPRAKRLKLADDIINNNSDLRMLKTQVHTLHHTYLELAHAHLPH